MARVFVTGAAGLLGTNIIKELIRQKYSVVGLIRATIPSIRHRKVTYMKGDILNKKTIQKAMKGCDYVIHAAALATPWPTRSTTIFKVNLNGTKTLLQAAKEEGIRRFVHVSTANCFLPGSKKTPGTEQYLDPLRGRVLDYIRSKKAAQDYVLAQHDVPVIVVAPTFMIGPGGMISNEMVFRVARGDIPGYTKGGKNFIAVQDVAGVCVAALTKGKTAESYLLANKNLSYKEFFALVANCAGITPPRRFIPSFAVLAYGLINSIISQLTSKRPLLSFTMALYSLQESYYDAKKARRELGLSQTSIVTAIKGSLEWLKQKGKL